MAWTESDPVAVELALIGVWLHNPEDPENTSRAWPYGASQRDDSLDTMGEARYYAGRADPVVDYGEHQALVVGVAIDVPHGATWRDDLDALEGFATSRATLHFRDNRGRALYGQMADFKRKDMDWGTQVTFTVTQSAWDRELVS